jgi:hypothetical protein
MPIKFKPHSGQKTGPNPFEAMQGTVRDALHLPPQAKVLVSMSETYIDKDGIRVRLPIGVSDVKNGADMSAMVEAIQNLFAGTFAGSGDKFVVDTGGMKEVAGPAPTGGAAKSYDDMTDEEWVQAVSANLFPGVIPLYQATAMHQPVTGTSSGSIYRTCFIGPHLKVAARLKNGNVSFRVTTDQNKAPEGQVRAIFDRLGVVNEYGDRLTCHAQMTGPYTAETAGEYRALFGAFYAALRPWITSGFPAIGKLAEGVK